LPDNSSSVSNQFSATPSLLGYLYQCRVALLESIKKLRNDIDFLVYIEILDDVAFETGPNVYELFQTKHHINQKGDLTDASSDLWKTIRIWSEGYSSKSIPQDSSLFLITTSQISENSIAWYLKQGDTRNTAQALSAMNSVVNTSTNKANISAYDVFRKLSQDQKNDLVNSITIIDSFPSITVIEEHLKQELFYAVEKKHLSPFLSRLEGWWLKRVIRQLTSTTKSPILDKELYGELNDLREQFKQDNLPIDDDIISYSIDSMDEYTNEIFVNQLRLIEINNKRILHAIINYYRAFNQRSRWIKDDLLMVGELEKFEKLLLEEWEIRFEQMVDEIGDSAADKAKIEAAQALYKWVESGTLRQIRSNVTEPFIARGSYQILSNEQRIWWHPDFKERIKIMLGIAEETA